MADNSTQGGTDTIRDLARQSGSVKTQVVQLDIGGASANAEVLVTAGQQLKAASLPVVLASDQPAISVSQVAPTRNLTTLRMDIPVVTTATDALQSLTGFKSGAAVTATTTPAVVTSGKTFRVQTISVTYVAIATAGTAKFTLRANAAGAVALGSPAVLTAIVGGPAAVAGVSQTYDLAIPDGMEFAAGTGIGVSMVGLSTTQAAAAVGYGQIAIIGYEY